MRRTRRLLSTGTTEVSAGAEETTTRGGGIPLVHPWAPSDAVTALPEGGNRDDMDTAPPVKRLKLPDKVLTRLGKTPPASGKGNVEGESAAKGVAEVIRSKKLAAAKHHASASDIEAGDDLRALVSVRRIPRPQPRQGEGQQRSGELNPPAEHFANSNDEFIRFAATGRAEDSDSSSLISSWSDEKLQDDDSNTDARAEKQRRVIDRHFAGYESENIESLSEEEEGEEEETSGSESSENDDGGEDGKDNNVPPKNEGDRAGFGLLERRRHQQREQQAQKGKMGAVKDEGGVDAATNHTSDRRYRYTSMFFEMHIAREAMRPCHHTLMCLSRPVTVQGPCGIIGFGIGEVAVGGFFLGKKQINLFSEADRVVLTPVQRLKSKNAGLESLPVPVPFSFKAKNDPVTVVPPTIRESYEDAADDNDVEIFGAIDWVWVEKTIGSWRGRFANKMPSIVLVVQPYDPYGLPPTRRHRLKGRGKKLTDAFMDVPRFVARGNDVGIDAVLLPEVIPAIVKQGTGVVVVLGSQNIGKSTLARFIANALFSQHGVCYWLDLDLGQPEFSPPGVFSLYCVQQPLLRPRDTRKVKLVKGFFLGGSRPRCPAATAIAIEQLCAIVGPLQRRFPVVVNTHGWVLSTGRRMTVEAIRRLQPKHIVHLVKEGETRWARDSELLMCPTKGLNSEVLHKRFFVRRAELENTKRKVNDVIGRLPYPHSVMNRPEYATTAEWSGRVHTVNVTRSEGSLQQGIQPKASAIRSAIWQQHLAPIFCYYETLDEKRRQNGGSELQLTEADESTTLFKGQLRHFESIVLAGVDDARDMTDDMVCAALERSVVALSFSLVPSSSPLACATQRQEASNGPLGNYRSLMDMPKGFSFSCFGFVESTEAEMRVLKEVKIRLPYHRDVVRGMLSKEDDTKMIRVSLACTLAACTDTAALEAYFYGGDGGGK
ncbi:hypothetical protein TCSYLVIO_009757 [Trypanosoma cruzi]|nr:hypothetical protein TCSYLVIO_009757 [Trypanosoma cruzi]